MTYQHWAKTVNDRIMQASGLLIVPQLRTGNCIGWVGVGWWLQVKANFGQDGSATLEAIFRSFDTQSLDHHREYKPELSPEGAEKFGRDAARFIGAAAGLATPIMDLLQGL